MLVRLYMLDMLVRLYYVESGLGKACDNSMKYWQCAHENVNSRLKHLTVYSECC